MVDLLLCTDGDYEGDLDLTENGDIRVGCSIPQMIKMVIKWIYGEWRFGPELGLPWYEKILVKNPNIALIRQEILTAVTSVDGVLDADIEILEYSPNERTLRLQYTVTASNDETYTEEVVLGG